MSLFKEIGRQEEIGSGNCWYGTVSVLVGVISCQSTLSYFCFFYLKKKDYY